jgi:hypothetical protein
MAIYSLNVASVGKSTHAPGTAGAHVRYIAREDACTHLDGAHMPTEPATARAWMDAQERHDRKNARIIDKLRVAIPRELNVAQRVELVRAFVIDVTGGRTPWLAAFHQTGEDVHNPHAHIIVRDRDFETGKRVLRWSDSPRDRDKLGLPPNAVAHIRERWEALANEALARADHAVRIDRRTLEAQGIDRIPTIHIGPQAQHIEREVSPPVSQARPQRKRRLRQSGHPGRDTADYPYIDAGRTRKERNAEIIDLNLERAARSADFGTRERALFVRNQIRLDRALEKELAVEARRRTQERRRTKAALRLELSELRTEWAHDRRATREHLAGLWTRERAGLAQRHQGERLALKARQERLGSRLMRFIDITGTTRRKQASERQALSESQGRERQVLAAEYRQSRTTLLAAVDAQHQPAFDDARRRASTDLSRLRERHAADVRRDDQRRQGRASERERMGDALEARIDAWSKEAQKPAQRLAAGQGPHSMPKDRDGNWVPEAHKTGGYTDRQKGGAQKTLADFNAVRAGDAKAQKQALSMKPDPANKIMARDLRPGSQTNVRNTANGQAREDRARKQVETLRADAAKDVSRAFQKNDLSRKFNNPLDRGRMGKSDLER